MHKIDTVGATPSGTFTDGDVQTGTPPTPVGEDWLNAMQGEVVAVIEAAGIVLDKSDNTQLAQALGILGGTTGTLKNYLINGDFRIWQRGTSFVDIDVTYTYTADRWVIAGDFGAGTGLVQVSRSEINPAGVAEIGDAGVGQQNAFWALELQVNTGEAATVSGPLIEQRADHLLELAEQEVCFSAYFESGGLTRTGTMQIVQHFGSGGSADVVAVTEDISFQGSFKRIHVAGELPTVFGKTIAADAHIKVRYFNDAGQIDNGNTVRFTLAQLERGASPSRFAYRPPQLELMLAERFYEKSYPEDIVPGTPSTFGGEATAYSLTSTQPMGLDRRFRVRKRAVPTLIWYDPAGGSPNTVNWNGISPAVISSGLSLSEDSTGIPTLSSSQPSGPVLGHWVADAEF